MFLFSLCLGFALHYIHAFHIRLFFVCFSKKKKKKKIKKLKKQNKKKKKKKMERGMWKDVFCITYHECVVEGGHIIFT